MALGVLNNLSAIYAENNLNNTNSNLQTVLQQLSSGSRINSGADDAAGLSLVNGLQANTAALTQSETNAAEGVGLLQVADGALSQVTNLLNRAITLAAEASNGTLNSTQDSAANQEYQTILAEISNIGSTTTYNQQQVFNGANVAIYTGDSSSQGSSIDDLYIRSLSSSSVGDTNGSMSYSNGQNNVFIDLSKGGANAAATDSLNAAGSTTITVNYLAKGTSGSVTQATANITVGSGTNYANTAQGLIEAINNSGLGMTATFTTAAQAGAGASAAAASANDTNSALLTTNLDTGIEISGTGIGVNTNAPGTYTNGAGEVGTLTVSDANDGLGGILNIVGTDGFSHAVTLGATNSTDNLANLASTINASGYGVTATINAGAVTNASGTHAVGTIMTLTSASKTVTVSGTSITDSQANATNITLGASVGVAGTVGYVPATITVSAATNTLTGVLHVTPASAAATPPAVNLDLNGLTLTQIAANFNGTGASNWSTYNISATLAGGGTQLIFTETVANGGTGQNAAVVTANGSQIQSFAATTGTAVVAQTAALAAGSTNSAFGTLTVSNANDYLTSGTLKLMDASGVQNTVTLGTAGLTDTLANLATFINTTMNSGTATNKLVAAVSQNGTTLTLSTSAVAGGTVPMLYASVPVTTSFSLTGTPTPNADNSTIMGTLGLPVGGASGDTLSGTLTIGTESITLGTAGRTNNLTNLAQTINSSTLGVIATLNSAGTAITLKSADSLNSGVTPTVAAALDTTDGSLALTWSTANQGQTSSQYYNLGISGTITDTSTGGGTAVVGLSFDQNGTGGAATISYSDTAGASLSSTDLLSQADAQAALTALNIAITDVAAQDGYLGAQINTLRSLSQVMSTQQENVVSAQNAIQATDYASATSNMSKFEILTQTGIAALAQANSIQQEVTKLLQ
jgi:flagellin